MQARMDKQAKIVATIGPATTGKDMLHRLVMAGVNVFRMNFSHGSHDEHLVRLGWLKDLEAELNRPVGVFMDLQGPKFRLGAVAGKIDVDEGQEILFDLKDDEGTAARIPLPHPEIHDAVETGSRLLIDDGKVQLEVTERLAGGFRARAVNAGTLSSRKGVSLPDNDIAGSPITAKDRADLEFGLAQGIKSVALSFVQRPEDLHELRDLAGPDVQLIAKIEKPSALARLDAIVDATDVVMVARGDLGVELPPEKVPVIQKLLTSTCRAKGKPVIVATQMLESMISCPVPTRAEASDVATAIYDGVDAVMLSAETAAGQYPFEAVDMMARIIGEIEADGLYRTLMKASLGGLENTGTDAISSAAGHVARTVGAEVVLCYTTTGKTALRAARERPEAKIVALTSSPVTARKMALVWGVSVILLPETEDMKSMVPMALEAAKQAGLVTDGQKAVITAGVPFGDAGSTNILRIATVGSDVGKSD